MFSPEEMMYLYDSLSHVNNSLCFLYDLSFIEFIAHIWDQVKNIFHKKEYVSCRV